MNLSMQLDDLIHLTKYNEENQLTFRDALAKALAGRIDIYYVFDGRSLVIYEPAEESFKGNGTKDNMIGGPDDVEIEYLPGDFVKLTDLAPRELWGFVTYSEFKLTLLKLTRELAPEGFELLKMLDGTAREITLENLYVSSPQDSGQASPKTSPASPSNTSLKVIGLLMHHLAKSPKYASGTTPNKSEIKKLLLSLADELHVNDYGLNKVDERLLTEAMKYLETQQK
jgi:hypothetical protein